MMPVLLSPAGFSVEATERRDIGEVVRGLPAQVGDLADRLGGGLGRGIVEKDVGAEILELDDLGCRPWSR